MAIATVAGTQAPISHRLVGVIEDLNHAGVTVGTALLLGQLVIVSGVVNAAWRERDVIRSRLITLLGPQGVRDAIGHGIRTLEGRDFAFCVHGEVQNRLIALAGRLDAGEATPEILTQVMDVLDAVEHDPTGSRSLTARLEELATRWRGIARIEIRHVPTTDIESTTADRIVHLVVEAITNAVRHGSARALSIEIEPVGTTL